MFGHLLVFSQTTQCGLLLLLLLLPLLNRPPLRNCSNIIGNLSAAAATLYPMCFALLCFASLEMATVMLFMLLLLRLVLCAQVPPGLQNKNPMCLKREKTQRKGKP